MLLRRSSDALKLSRVLRLSGTRFGSKTLSKETLLRKSPFEYGREKPSVGTLFMDKESI